MHLLHDNTSSPWHDRDQVLGEVENSVAGISYWIYPAWQERWLGRDIHVDVKYLIISVVFK